MKPIEEMTDDELLEYEKDCENKIAKYDNLQGAMKILLNSSYGSVGNPYFRFYDIRIAEAITTSGQLSIRWIAKKLNEYFDSLTGEEKDRVIAIDTDSVGAESKIYVNNEKLRIDEFWNMNNVDIETGINGGGVKNVSDHNFYTYSCNKAGELEEKKVVFIMKHEVEKEMYEVKFEGKTVRVTEDHSLIVKDNQTGKLVPRKPEELNANDEIIEIVEE